MKLLSIVGARPEFVQAAPVSAALRPGHQEVLVHTGQHYDFLMSQVFFQELEIPAPNYHLGVGSGPHGRQTGEMLAGLEEVMTREQPDWVIVRGDTNSTLAGALAAAKLGLPLVHIESGARSFNRQMPEELNRVVVDHVADLLFCVAPSAVENLRAEGLTSGVHYVGDVMYDAFLRNLPVAQARSRIRDRLGLQPGGYLLATVHRASNTDDAENLRAIVRALGECRERVIFPVHPRTRRAIDNLGLRLGPRVTAIGPVAYSDMLVLESQARLVLTDSGGVTREAYFAGVPCLTLREETEHVETVTAGWNTLVGPCTDRILDAVRRFRPTGDRPAIFGDGAAARRIVDVVEAASPDPTLTAASLRSG